MKINRYEYKCSACVNEYIEQRKESESQYFTQCSKCNADLVLENTVFLEDEVIQPAVVDEAPTL